MSIFDIVTCITIFIVTILLVKGGIVWLYTKFKPLKYIQLTVTDNNGVKHSKKLFLDDENFIDEILDIRKKQKLVRGKHRAK
ncbi:MULTISPECIES: hypothetical protein [unclassified Gilliamella]|uniref:hypothetical protein n=1 Tax=unclassified Gilliamella TaxID=2685620 RepID=UPI00226AC64F|nr:MULTISPECIES: hypothetical protein [unclassified Gilliamella]MCX8665667.1 hypothetical protein [Gilliamella sp. B2887]MCX8698575.1 hypothetical protein [Gilliamella sp. B3000]